MLDTAAHAKDLKFVSRAVKKARRRGVVPRDGVIDQRWATVAEKAIDRVEAAGYGRRGSVISEAAGGLGVKQTYLRQAIAAYKFATSKTIEGVSLLTFPIGVVEDLRRWSEIDLSAATKAAKSLAEGEIDLEEFAEQALAARQTDAKDEPAYRASGTYKARVRRVAERQLPGFQLGSDAQGFSEGFITLRSPDGSEHAAIVVTGPYDDPERELVSCKEASLKALGLLLTNERVVLACGSQRSVEHARSLLADMRRARGVVFRDAQFDERFTLFGPADLESLEAKACQTAPSAHAAA